MWFSYVTNNINSNNYVCKYTHSFLIKFNIKLYRKIYLHAGTFNQTNEADHNSTQMWHKNIDRIYFWFLFKQHCAYKLVTWDDNEEYLTQFFSFFLIRKINSVFLKNKRISFSLQSVNLLFFRNYERLTFLRNNYRGISIVLSHLKSQEIYSFLATVYLWDVC